MRKGDIKKMVARPITVVQMLPELEGGGVERGTLELGDYLSKNGHKSIVISAGGRMVPQLEKQGSVHICWRVGEKSPRCLGYIIPLRSFLMREKIDILHLRSRLPAWIGYAAWKSLPKGMRPRLVTTFHGFYSVNRYSAVMTKGERVIAISRTIADHIKDKYGVLEDRIVLIYRGFDEKVFNPSAVTSKRIETLRRNWNLKDTASPVIMLPGRLTRLKGHDLFLESLSNIKHLPWSAVCVGDTNENPAYSNFLQKMILQLNLEKRVKFVGHCDDMPAAFLLSDIVVSASSSKPEAFGRIAVEGQAMGKPVIALAHGGSLESVLNHKSGWLVRPGDAKSLADSLCEAVSNKDLRNRLGSYGQRWVRDKFTVRKMCEKTVNLYCGLIKERE